MSKVLSAVAILACALSHLSCADSGSPNKPRGRAAMTLLADPTNPLSVDERIRFNSALHFYDPITDISRLELDGSSSRWRVTIEWQGDAPVVGNTAAGDAVVILYSGLDTVYAADQFGTSLDGIDIEIGLTAWAASDGERTEATFGGEAEKVSGPGDQIVRIANGSCSAIRR